MSTGFYELLGVLPDAPLPAIRAAYQEQVAQVVRRLRAAEARQQDTSTLEARRAGLAEAVGVLSDPARRRRYDRYRELARDGFPADLEELWRAAGPSLVEPAAAAALDVIRTLTAMKVGDGFGVVEAEAEPEPSVVPVESSRTAPLLDSREDTPRAADGTRSRAPSGMDRSLPSGEVQRLLDVYGPTGAWLRAGREARKLDLEALSQTTKIALRFLEAMETENWAALPAATFVRGYLRVVLRDLQLCQADEVEEVVTAYMARFHRARD